MIHNRIGKDFNTLNTQRLILRRFRQEDAEEFFQYRSDPLVTVFQSWKPCSVEEINAFIAQQLENSPNTPGTWFQLAVCKRDDRKLIGDCGIHFIENDDAQVEIGFTIAPAYQRNGYATEAVRSVLDYLFINLRKHRVYASVDPGNLRSIALLERIGMRKEAHFKKSIYLEDGWADDLIYAILEEEWKSQYSM